MFISLQSHYFDPYAVQKAPTNLYTTNLYKILFWKKNLYKNEHQYKTRSYFLQGSLILVDLAEKGVIADKNTSQERT